MKLKLNVGLSVVSVLCCSSAFAAGVNVIPPKFGAAFWDGQYSGSAPGFGLRDGLAYLASQGIQTVKVSTNPYDMIHSYGIQVPTGTTDTNYLATLANMPAFVTAFQNPNISTVVFSTYDAIVVGLNGGATGYANAAIVVPRQDDLIQTYHDFALALFKNYKGSGKHFVISTWETENSLYCGDAWDFLKNLNGVRQQCLNKYQATYGADSPNTALANILIWFKARQTGIMNAQNDAAALGYTGVSVVDGIEFDSVHSADGSGYPSALADIIPQIHPAVIAYSSYESVNLGTLLEDFPTIEAQAGGSQIFITEYGFFAGGIYPINGTSQSSNQMMSTTTQQMLELQKQGRLGAAIVWEAFQGADLSQQFGLFNNDGTSTSLFTAFLNGLGTSTLPPPSGPAPFISGIKYDSLDIANNLAYLTLYGSNLAAGSPAVSSLQMNCAQLSGTNGTYVYVSPAQINASFTLPSHTRTCTVTVTQNGQTSSGQVNVPGADGSQPTTGGTPSIALIKYDSVDPASGLAYLTVTGSNLASGSPAATRLTMDCGFLSTSNGSYDYISPVQINASFMLPSHTQTCTVAVSQNGQISSGQVVVAGSDGSQPPSSGGPTIAQISYDGASPSGQAYITVYGSNLASGSPATTQISMNCAQLSTTNGSSVFVSATQINASFKLPSQAQTCTVSVTQNGQSANHFVAIPGLGGISPHKSSWLH